jgi:hypothetical protein
MATNYAVSFHWSFYYNGPDTVVRHCAPADM